MLNISLEIACQKHHWQHFNDKAMLLKFNTYFQIQRFFSATVYAPVLYKITHEIVYINLFSI